MLRRAVQFGWLGLAAVSVLTAAVATAGVVIGFDQTLNRPYEFPAARDPAVLCSRNAANPPQRMALLVAISTYRDSRVPKLLGPANDARILESALRARGFDVQAALDATRVDFLGRLNETIARARCGDRVFLSISSHSSLGSDGWPVIMPSDFSRACAERGAECSIRDIDLASAIVALRNRGADVFVLLDVHNTKLFRLVQLSATEVSGLWKWPPEVQDSTLELQHGAGTVTVFGAGETAAELPLPEGAPRPDIYGSFSFAVASALNEAGEASVRRLAERTEETYKALPGRANAGTYESTDAQLAFFAVADQASAPSSGSSTQALRFEILSPEITRGVMAVPAPTVRLEGRLLEPREPEALLVAGQLVDIENGRFTADVALSSAQSAITLLGVFRNGEQVELRNGEVLLDWSRVSTAEQFKAGRRVALLIANSDYEGSGFGNLVTPGKDIEDLERILRETYGFETLIRGGDGQEHTLVLKNANERQIMSTLNRLQQLLTSNDSLLIFYAGHGMYSTQIDQAYWIPRDGLKSDITTWISARSITDILMLTAARHILVVADSCYSGGLNRGDTILEDYSAAGRREMLTKMYSRPSRYLISSGALEPVWDGGGNGHSIFAGAFLRGLAEMSQHEFTANELFGEFLVEAVAGTSDQVPQLEPIRSSGHEGGGFVFVRTPQSAPP